MYTSFNCCITRCTQYVGRPVHTWATVTWPQCAMSTLMQLTGAQVCTAKPGNGVAEVHRPAPNPPMAHPRKVPLAQSLPCPKSPLTDHIRDLFRSDRSDLGSVSARKTRAPSIKNSTCTPLGSYALGGGADSTRGRCGLMVKALGWPYGQGAGLAIA